MTAHTGLSWAVMEEDGPRPRREIRITIPDFGEVKTKAAKASDAALVSVGLWGRRHPLLATIITLALIAIARVLVGLALS